MIINTQIHDSDWQRLQALPELLQDLLKRAALRIANKTITKLDVPHATGQLSRSLRALPTASGADVLVDTAYSALVHDGRKGGQALRLTEIQAWVRVKGIDEAAAYPIAQSIADKGTQPNPFLSRYVSSIAFERMARDLIKASIQRAVS